MNKAKPFNIDKRLVWQSWLAVKANRGSAGIDGVTLSRFEDDLSKNLYKIWNRLSSGSYMPPPVKRVEIPKSDGRMRPLGIPTVSDRVAQMTVKMSLEPQWDSLFHPSSFGYRPRKSAHDAVLQARNNCWTHQWVIDLDIKGFFDNIDHHLMMKAVDHLEPPKWARICIKRWLKADVILPDGNSQSGEKGTPQGGVISPLLANLFLHYAHDQWLVREYPELPFERYADDAVIHCRSQFEAETLLTKLKHRMRECGLTLHPEKTRIVCCNPNLRKESNVHYEFDFLGFTFRRRGARRKKGGLFTGFLPAISKKAKKAIVRTFRSWNIQRCTWMTIEQIAKKINPQLRGWINYYGKFYISEMNGLWRILNERLVRWFRSHSKRYRWHKTKAAKALQQIRLNNQYLFAHWMMKVF